MTIIEGSHGTSVSRSQKIKKYGWHLNEGRAGTGVYFWVKSGYYIQLAQAWHRQCIAENRFRRDGDKKCCIIIVQVEADDEEILNCETGGLRESILELAIEKNINLNSSREVAAVFDLFIKSLEKKSDLTYKVLLIKVPTPKPEYLEDYPYKILSSPMCCVAREEECIDIIETRE